MELRRCADPEELLAVAGDHLTSREAEHNLIFGILGTLQRQPAAFGTGEPYLAALVSDGEVAGVAVRTPPFGPVLSELDDVAAVDVVADDLATVTHELAGVLGRRDLVERFARRWTAITGAAAKRQIEERIYRTESASAPAGVPGAPRRYTAADRQLVIAWLEAFNDDAHPAGGPTVVAEAWLDRRLTDPDGEVLLWERAGEPVSLAAAGQATPNGLRVGPVYTPPAHRRHGYAEAVTAEVTRRALARGRRFCFLFTDLANPTSNAIYQRIGYEPVCDVDQWAFTHH